MAFGPVDVSRRKSAIASETISFEHVLKTLPTLLGALTVSACAVVGPDYTSPQVAMAERFTFAQSSQLRDTAYDRWWTELGDPALNQLMVQGLQRSLDIRIARARLVEAEALLRAEGVTATQLSGTLDARSTSVRSGGTTTSSQQLTLSGTYVFDIFGGLARGRERAQAELEARTFDVAAVRLAFQAELVGAVIEARFAQASTRATQRTIESRRRILNSIQQMFGSGELTRDDVVRAQARVSEAEADLPAFRNVLHLNAIVIATLLDVPAGTIVQTLRSQGGGQPIPSRQATVGVPADLLRNRPDVVAAERRLAAAFAAIGVAEARLYPALNLSGTITVDSPDSFSLGPRLSLPLLGRDRLIALREATESRANEAELTWRSTLTRAVADVERALVGIETSRAEIAALNRASVQFRTLSDLSRETFSLGDITVLELLDTEQEIQRNDLALARARRDLALATARLSVATGRGQLAGVEEHLSAVATAPQ
ncbi:MAG: efflux transporter outer membrane subunit [Jannaschia sp.]